MPIVIGLVLIAAMWIVAVSLSRMPGANREVRFYSGFRIARYLTVVIGLVAILGSMVTVIGPGEVGVQILFGAVQPEVLHSGLHLINPVVQVERMTVRTQSYTMSATTNEGEVKGDDAIIILTADGLSVKIDVTVLYHLDDASAVKVYRELGADYVPKLVRPAIRTAIRDVTVSYSATDIYSTKREEVVQKVLGILVRDMQSRGIIPEQVLVRNVELPQQVQQAINEKLTAEQEAQKMTYVLQKEEQEAKRKTIEAGGIAEAQRVIAGSLTMPYLQWKYIESLQKMAESQNTAFVITPFDQKLTPLLNFPAPPAKPVPGAKK